MYIDWDWSEILTISISISHEKGYNHKSNIYESSYFGHVCICIQT